VDARVEAHRPHACRRADVRLDLRKAQHLSALGQKGLEFAGAGPGGIRRHDVVRLFARSIKSALLLGGLAPACTVDVGENFQVSEIVYDESYFYCEVEPILFERGCGSGDPSLGESAQGCHFNRQRLRLTNYEPLIAEQCADALNGDLAVSPAAQQNYQSAQLQMEVDPERSPLLNRPTSAVAHPRVVFELDSEEAAVIRGWGARQ
jgi:hypothetical protein